MVGSQDDKNEKTSPMGNRQEKLGKLILLLPSRGYIMCGLTSFLNTRLTAFVMPTKLRYYRALPEHTYFFKDETAKRVKVCTERITVLCYVSMSGEKKRADDY